MFVTPILMFFFWLVSCGIYQIILLGFLAFSFNCLALKMMWCRSHALTEMALAYPHRIPIYCETAIAQKILCFAQSWKCFWWCWCCWWRWGGGGWGWWWRLWWLLYGLLFHGCGSVFVQSYVNPSWNPNCDMVNCSMGIEYFTTFFHVKNIHWNINVLPLNIIKGTIYFIINRNIS